MEYRAVGNRCAVNLDSFGLSISREETLIAALEKAGFIIIEVDIVALARQCIGISQYRRGARPSEAPTVVDCSSFIKWLYGMRGIWLPRRSIQQYGLGEAADIDELIAGDIVFMSCRIDYYHDDPANGVSHVGMATNDGTVIHAAGKNVGVIESSLDAFVDFADKTKFRGARRYIPKDAKVLTFETPAEREVETADDLKWIILQSI